MASLTKSSLTAGALKALGIFGGVQSINIIFSIVRTKLIAVWIGAAGVGLFGIYNSAIELLSIVFNLGIRDSAVRDIAASSDSSKNSIIIIVRRWALALGAIGLIITALFSPLLSNITFDNFDHTYAFIAIAFIIFLSSIQNGELAILQGSKQLSQLAKASVWGVVVGVILSIPMFYFWGIDSVIPALVTYSLATTLAVMTQRVNIKKPRPYVSVNDTLKKGQSFIYLGIFLTISTIVSHLVSFLFIIYLNNVGDTTIVGHYQAGFTIVNRYMGIIFTAIIMEYYPRLSQVKDSQNRTSTFVSHEISIMLWVLLPAIALFVASSELIVKLLYSSDFIVILPFIVSAVVGTIFRAISWCMAYVILARGDGKIYLLTESTSAIICIILNIVAYNIWDLDGLGYAYAVWYMIYALIIGVIYHYRYKLNLGKGIIRLSMLATLIALICSISYTLWGWIIPAIIGIVILPIAIKQILRKKALRVQH